MSVAVWQIKGGLILKVIGFENRPGKCLLLMCSRDLVHKMKHIHYIIVFCRTVTENSLQGPAFSSQNPLHQVASIPLTILNNRMASQAVELKLWGGNWVCFVKVSIFEMISINSFCFCGGFQWDQWICQCLAAQRVSRWPFKTENTMHWILGRTEGRILSICPSLLDLWSIWLMCTLPWNAH